MAAVIHVEMLMVTSGGGRLFLFKSFKDVLVPVLFMVAIVVVMMIAVVVAIVLVTH